MERYLGIRQFNSLTTMATVKGLCCGKSFSNPVHPAIQVDISYSEIE